MCFILFIEVLIWLLGGSFNIQFLEIFWKDFKKEFNWFRNRFLFLIKVFVLLLGESFEIQFLAIF
jgi:hypothetical protein